MGANVYGSRHRQMNRFVFLQLLAACVAFGQVDVLTANYDNNRTSSNLAESALNPTSVLPGSFGKVATFPVLGQIYAQPLLATAINVPDCGTCDVLFVATMENNVYAFNATTLDPAPS